MRRTVAVLLVAVLAMSITGCGGDPGSDGVATLGGGTGDDQDAAQDDRSAEETAMEFAECMRRNGVPDFADPEVTEDGGILMRRGPGGGGDVDRETAEKAMQACQEFAPRTGGRFSEEDRQEMQDAMLKYAECMREEGIGMPDPEFGDGTVRMGSPDLAEQPGFEEAHEACEDELPGRPGESS
jgi:hypothetical protein